MKLAEHAPPATRSLVDRVRAAIAALGCARVWARGTGQHVLVGLRGADAFARIAAQGSVAFTLAFRSPVHTDDGAVAGLSWEPLLVDELHAVVEHALVAVDAI